MTLSLAFALIALLAFANGSNDVSKSVATLVGGGVTDDRRALRWGTTWTVAGAFLAAWLGSGLAQRFAKSLGVAASHQPAIPLAVMISSLVWVAFASRSGLPVSTTHAIAGAILGVGWMAEGLSPWTRTDVLEGFFLPLLVSPLAAVALTFSLQPLVARAGRWLEARCACVVPVPGAANVQANGNIVALPALRLVVDHAEQCEGRSAWSWNLSLDQAHWISSGLVALSRGMNDAPKIWALVLPLLVLAGPRGLSAPLAIALVALAMGLGSWAAGRRVTEVLARRVTSMNRQDGFAANLSTALLVAGASRLGLPVSTTHVSTGAIVGAGLGRAKVNWRVFTEMAFAWFVTLPVAALNAAGCYWVLK